MEVGVLLFADVTVFLVNRGRSFRFRLKLLWRKDVRRREDRLSAEGSNSRFVKHAVGAVDSGQLATLFRGLDEMPALGDVRIEDVTGRANKACALVGREFSEDAAILRDFLESLGQGSETIQQFVTRDSRLSACGKHTDKTSVPNPACLLNRRRRGAERLRQAVPPASCQIVLPAFSKARVLSCRSAIGLPWRNRRDRRGAVAVVRADRNPHRREVKLKPLFCGVADDPGRPR